MIGEIITAVEKRMDATQCSGEGTCNAGSKCVAHNLWTELNENINSFLMKKSLKDVLNTRKDNPQEKDDFLIATG
jgi:Rrf2 family iron-sulfur cluster assembly transcriptional regulator